MTRRHPQLAALALWSGWALAQEGPPNSGGDSPPRQPYRVERVERVEVGARQSGTDLRRAAMVAKQIYGREELDKFGDSNALDVLKRLPGVSIQGGGPRMRGLGAGYTLILINGDPAPPGFALDQLPPSQIERIEVTKGPTADQSAQAVAGTINIILKDAPRVSQRDLRLGMNYATSRPTGNANITLGEKIGSAAVSLPISVFQWRNENAFATTRFMPGRDQQAARSSQDGVQPTWGHGFVLAPRVNWKISDEETFSLQSFVQKGRWNNRLTYENSVLSGMPTLDDDSNQYGTWQNLRGNLQWVNRFSDAQRIELKAGIQDSKNTFNSQTFRNGVPQLKSVGATEDRSLTQAGKYSHLLGDEHTLTVGWDFEYRRRDETRTSSELGVLQLPEFEGQPFSARIERQAVFFQDEWELSPQWSTYLGLRNENITTESRGTLIPVRNTSSVLTPLWHLNYKLDPKGRDMIRASLTRSYKAPPVNSLLARPSINSLFTDVGQPNTELSPDRTGNPSLRPELATGLDIAYENYMTGGGFFSIGVFQRRVADLVRSVTALQTVAWATVPRWVSQPSNFSSARTTGIELELKGRAGELLPSVFDPKLGLNMRGSLSFYRSTVDALSGPNNRLDGQQPWSGNFGFDYRFASLPLTTGAGLVFTPGYDTQQSASQNIYQGRTRNLDWFAQWTFSRTMSLRASANNLAPFDTQSQTVLTSGYGSTSNRKALTQYGVALELKL